MINNVRASLLYLSIYAVQATVKYKYAPALANGTQKESFFS
jgi:hypothetical protein